MGDGPVGSYAELRGHERLRLDGRLAVRGDVRRGACARGKEGSFHDAGERSGNKQC